MSQLFRRYLYKTKEFKSRILQKLSIKPNVSSSNISQIRSKLITSTPSLSIHFPFHKHKFRHSNRYKYAYSALTLYLCAEFLFYFRCKYLEDYANNISVDIVQPIISHKRCQELFDLALKYAGLYEEGYIGWLKLWYNDCEIKDLRSGNILELFYWGFFVEHYNESKNKMNDLSQSELEWREEFVQNGLIELEKKMNYKFPKGYNQAINDKFNTKQSVKYEVQHHSLALYGIVSFIQSCSNFMFEHYFQFEYEWINDIKVWYKLSPQNKTNNALMLLHGIGIGLGPYYQVIKALLHKNENEHFMDLMCMIEIPYICMNIFNLLPWPFSSHSYITQKLPPSINEYIQILNAMQKKLGTKKKDIEWTLIGHSYGSMIASNIYLQSEQSKKPRLILIDPACFMLSHPSTVSAFVTNIDAVCENDEHMPTLNARKLLAKELMISCNLRRYFHWYDLVLYPEQIADDQKKHIVVTSEKDNFVPLGLIEKGIKNVNDDKANNVKIMHASIDVGHGEWIWDDECIKYVLDIV